MTEEFGEAYWEERYGGAAAVWSGQPNPSLLAEAADLTPGTALEAGCGEGADAVWLASQGWQVTAVDIAGGALRRAREHAESLDAGVAARIDWVQADLADWAADGRRFDLVTSHYVHVPGSPLALYGRLAEAVAPGGRLLVVGHDPSHPQHGSAASAYLTADEIAAGLDPERWEIVVAEVRTRPATHAHGSETTLRDAVLHARRRA